MLDAQDVETILHMLDVCHSEGIGPSKDAELKLLRKAAKLINTVSPFEAYDHIKVVDQVIKEFETNG